MNPVEKRQHTDKRVVGRFIPQAWINDYAVDLDDGRAEFDCTERILEMGRENALVVRDNRDTSDELVPQRILRRHNGPYRVEVEDAIRDFFGETSNV